MRKPFKSIIKEVSSNKGAEDISRKLLKKKMNKEKKKDLKNIKKIKLPKANHKKSGISNRSTQRPQTSPEKDKTLPYEVAEMNILEAGV